MFNALEETTSYVLVYDKSEGQITASDLLFVIAPYLVHDVVISMIRSQFMSHCMTVVAPLAGATDKTGDGKWYGNRIGDGREWEIWYRSRNKTTVASRDPVYKQ